LKFIFLCEKSSAFIFIINRFKLRFHFLWYRKNLTKLNVYLIFLNSNILVSSANVKDLLHSLRNKNIDQPNLYYFNSTVVHPNSYDPFPVNRPLWSPILFDQVFYLGEFLVLLTPTPIDFDICFDIKKYILNNSVKVVKNNEQTYLNLAIHNMIEKNFSVVEPELSDPIVYDAAINKNLSIIIPSTFKSHSTSYGVSHSLIKLINSLNSIAIKNGVEFFEIIIIYGNEYDVIGKKLFDDELIGNTNLIIIKDSSPFNFSKRVNIGLEQSMYDFIFVLNDDVEDLKFMDFSRVRRFLDQANVASVSFCLGDSNHQISHAGIKMTKSIADENLKGTYIFENNPQLLFTHEVDGNSFCLIFSTKQIFKSIGQLDENLPLDFNDVEWCVRGNKLGFRHLLIPQVVGKHNISATREKNISGGIPYPLISYAYDINNEVSFYEWTLPFCCLEELD